MKRQARRLTIFINENDQYHHHHPLYAEIVDRAHRMGLAGVTVLRGIEGYGRSSVIHTSRLLSLSEALPVAIVIVDDAERIDAFRAVLDELITEGLVVCDPVEVHRYPAAGQAEEGV